jgi:hypothetical protein
MGTPRQVIAINYFFTREDLCNRIFAPERQDGRARFLQFIRAYFRRRGGELVTLDTVDFHDPAVKHVLYFDYSWRYAMVDPFLRAVPREKRALIVIEPANVNPSLYYIPLLRDRFHTVFTWDLNLLRRNPDYMRINVPAGADPLQYRENRFRDLSFAGKKLAVAVSSNRWSYMPQSNFRRRIEAYRHFDRFFPEQFDLYGTGWNAPRIFYDKWFGFHRFVTFRGTIPPTSEEKVRTMSAYRFALCVENNAAEPGYISEKIIDCFCARCVPVYYGWKGAGDRIPRDAWIDWRDFRNLRELGHFLLEMDAACHARYIAAMDRFLQSDQIRFFTNDHLLDVIATGLGLPPVPEAATAVRSP